MHKFSWSQYFEAKIFKGTMITMGFDNATVIIVANSLCVQIFVALIFHGEAFPRKLVPNENFCLQ